MEAEMRAETRRLERLRQAAERGQLALQLGGAEQLEQEEQPADGQVEQKEAAQEADSASADASAPPFFWPQANAATLERGLGRKQLALFYAEEPELLLAGKWSTRSRLLLAYRNGKGQVGGVGVLIFVSFLPILFMPDNILCYVMFCL